MELDTIYNEDCLMTMNRMVNGYLDLVVTSPPYDNLRNYCGYSFDFERIAKELYRVIKDGGILVWVVGDATIKGSETGTSFKQALYFKEIGFNLHDTMIYLKNNPVPVGGNKRYYQAFEYIFVLSKGTPKTFNPITEKRRNKYNDKRTSRVKSFNRDVNGEFREVLYTFKDEVKTRNVFEYVIGGGNTCEIGINHSAIFPEKLAQDQIISWSNPNDVVYDPFMGSGTTAKMASINNRKFIGSEISKEYYELSLKRLKL